MSLPNFSIRRPVTILMLCLGMGLVGGISLTRLPIELYPNFSFGDISIIINIRGGMPPEEVENQVARPIEEAVGDVSHMKDIISISEEGRARVVLTFEPGTDMDFAALEVREKFSKVRNKLPKEIEKPIIAKFEQEDTPVLIMALAALDTTPEALRRLVDEGIKDRIMRVEGVANVDVGGGRERKILVEIDIAKLQAFRLPIDRVTRLLSVSNLNLLAGDVDGSRNKYLIRAMGEFESLKDLENLAIAVTPSRSVIRLKDLATVKDSYLEAESYARVNALPVVSLYVQKETTANTVEVVKHVLQVVEQIQKDPKMPKNIRFIVTNDQSVQILRAIDLVGSSLISGATLAILVLGMFLASNRFLQIAFIPTTILVTLLSVMTYRFQSISVDLINQVMNWFLLGLLVVAVSWKHLRLTLICALAIPVATIVTFGFMFFMNLTSKRLGVASLTLNVMTLGGLALGVGMLVDNAIVVIDNILKFRTQGVAAREAADKGASEMWLAILASSMTNVVVFLPIVFINKEIRILYTGFAMTNCFSLLASLLVALTVVPLLASRLPFPVQVARKKPLWIRTKYRAFMAGCLRWRWVVFITVFFICLAASRLSDAVPKEFLGAAEAEDFTVFVELPSGAKLEISDQAVSKIEELLKDVPEIKSVSSRVEKWSSKIYVKLLPLAERSRSTKDVMESLRPKVDEIEKGFKEAFIYFEEPRDTESNEVILEIYGWDYEVLNQLAVEMLKRMQSIQGLTDLKIRWRRGRPEWLVRVDKIKAARYGLSVEDVSQTLHAEMRGLRATLYHTESKEVEVVTRLGEADRATLDKLRRLTFTLPNREVVTLEQIGKLEPSIGPSKIWRKNKQRMIQVSANRGRYAFGDAAKKVNEAIKNIPFPEDYYWKFGANYWKLIQNQDELTFAKRLSIGLVFLVLASLFESILQPFIIILGTVPMAAFGAFLTLKLTHQSMNVGALMGTIMLVGVVVNNAIILVDEINRLQSQGYRLRRALVNASVSRVRPIAMTSLTTILGFLPLALSRTEESSLWAPMALVSIGGLSFSTFMTPIVTPSLYLCLHDLNTISVSMIRFISNPFRKISPTTLQ